MTRKLTIGHIPFVNCEPFYSVPLSQSWQRKSAAPRPLAMLLEEGLLDAAPLSLVDTWRLDHWVEPLGDFGVGVRESCDSVLLLSRRPLWEESGLIAVTDQSSTAVRLLQVLLEEKYRLSPHWERRPHPEEGDESWLVIGDEALKLGPHSLPQFPHTIDLVKEWWEWKTLPFVFAQWVVRRGLSKKRKVLIQQWLESSLSVGLKSLAPIAARRAEDVGVSEKRLFDYLNSFHYRLGREDEQAMDEFRHLLKRQETRIMAHV